MNNKNIYISITLIWSLLLMEGCYTSSSIPLNEMAENRTDKINSIELNDGRIVHFDPDKTQYIEVRNGIAGKVFNEFVVIYTKTIREAVTYEGIISKEDLMIRDTCTILQLNLANDKKIFFQPDSPGKYYYSANLITGIDDLGQRRVFENREIRSVQIDKMNAGLTIVAGIGVIAIGVVVVFAVIMHSAVDDITHKSCISGK